MDTVVITGAGRGLGLELVKLNINKGNKVYALSHSMTDELKEALDSSEGLCKVYLCELTCEQEIKEIAEDIKDELDVVYNVAGLYYENQRVGISGTSIDESLKMYQVNALAPMCMIKYLEAKIKNNALIVNVSSEAGSIGECLRDMEYGYCMSKAGFNMASKMMSNELSSRGIKILVYHPGWLRTQMGGERAAASSASISALESAGCLEKIINDFMSSDEMLIYIDYQKKHWEW